MSGRKSGIKVGMNYILAELPCSFPLKINQDAPFKINQEKLSVNGDLVLLLWNLSGGHKKPILSGPFFSSSSSGLIPAL